MFEEQLIEAVKSHPCIYDKSLQIYRDKLKKEKAWMDVSTGIGMGVEQCQSRWRSLRDRFLKEIQKKPKSGSATIDQSQWKFSPALEFLRKHVAPRRTFSNTRFDIKDELLSPTDSETRFFTEEFGLDDGLVDNPPEIGIDDREIAELSEAEYLLSTADDLNRSSADLPSTSAQARKRMSSEALFHSTPENSQSQHSLSSNTPSSISAASRKRRCIEHATKQFDLLVNAATNLMSAKKDKSRNEEYYRVLDGYLTKLPEDKQDSLKFKFLQNVVSEIEELKKYVNQNI